MHDESHWGDAASRATWADLNLDGVFFSQPAMPPPPPPAASQEALDRLGRDVGEIFKAVSHVERRVDEIESEATDVKISRLDDRVSALEDQPVYTPRPRENPILPERLGLRVGKLAKELVTTQKAVAFLSVLMALSMLVITLRLRGSL